METESYSPIDGGNVSNVTAITEAETWTTPPPPINTGKTSAYFLFIIAALAFLANWLVVLSIRRSMALQRMFYYICSSLAISNIFIASLIMPVFIMNHSVGDFEFPSSLCVVWVLTETLLLASCITHIIVLAYNTRCSLLEPLNYRLYQSPRHVLAQVTIAWGAAAFLAVPHLALALGHGVGLDKTWITVTTCSHQITSLQYYLAKFVPGFVVPFILAVGMCIWVAKDAWEHGRVLGKIVSVVENNGVICNGNAILPNLMVIEAALEAETRSKMLCETKSASNKSKGKPDKAERERSRRTAFSSRCRKSEKQDKHDNEGGNQMSVQAEVHSSDGSSNDGLDKDMSDFDDAESLTNESENNADDISDMDSVCRSISTNSSCSGFQIEPSDTSSTEGSVSTKDGVKACIQDAKEANESKGNVDAVKDGGAEANNDEDDTHKKKVDQSLSSYCERDDILDNAEKARNNDNNDQEDKTSPNGGSEVKGEPTIIEDTDAIEEKSNDNTQHQGIDDDPCNESSKDLLAPPPMEHKLDIEAATRRQMLESGSESGGRTSPSTSMASGYETLTSEVQSPEDGKFNYECKKEATSISRQDSGCETQNAEEPQSENSSNEKEEVTTKPVGKEILNAPVEEKDIDLVVGPDSEKLLNDKGDSSDPQGIDNPAFDGVHNDGIKKNLDGTISLSDAIKVRCPSVCSKAGEDKIEKIEANENALNQKSNSNDSLILPEDGELPECRIPTGRRSILKRDNSRRHSHRKSVKFASDVGEPKTTKRESRKIVRKGTKHVKVTHPEYARNGNLVNNLNAVNNNTVTNGHAPALSQLSMQSKHVLKKPLSPEVSSSLEYLTKLNSVQGKRATQRLKKDSNTLWLVVALLCCILFFTMPFIVVRGINFTSPDHISKLVVDILEFTTYCTVLVIPALMLLFSVDMRANCTGVVCCMPSEYGNSWGEDKDEEAQNGYSIVPLGQDLTNKSAGNKPDAQVVKDNISGECGSNNADGAIMENKSAESSQNKDIVAADNPPV